MRSEAASPAETIRPRNTRRLSSAETIHAPTTTRPIPISPRSSLDVGSSDYLSQRRSNLDWAIRHGDAELIRTERAAIERYKQTLVETYGVDSDSVSGTSSGASGSSAESNEIPIHDVTATHAKTMDRASGGGGGARGGLRYDTGRRLSCLATYTGFPVPPSWGESPSYSVALEGSLGAFAPHESVEPEVHSKLRRAPSPYPRAGRVVPLEPVRCDSPPRRPGRESSPARSFDSPFISNPTPQRLEERDDSDESTRAHVDEVRRPPRSDDSPPSSCSIAHATRVIHGFHINACHSTASPSSSPSLSPAPSPLHSPSPPSPGPGETSPHVICRGRAASVGNLVCGGLGGGNVQQARMELQASRDIEVLDRETARIAERRCNKGGRATEGVSTTTRGVRGGRAVDGKVAAAERLKKGYSGEWMTDMI